MSRTITALTLGTFRLIHAKQTGDIIALRRLYMLSEAIDLLADECDALERAIEATKPKEVT